MTTITYTITDELGLHARPAGIMVKMAKEWDGKVEICTSKKMVDCKRVIGVMGLALKQGDTLTMTFEGEDEEAKAEYFLEFLKQEL